MSLIASVCGWYSSARTNEKDLTKGLDEIPDMIIERRTDDGKYVIEKFSVLGELPQHPDSNYSNPDVKKTFDEITGPQNENRAPEHADSNYTDPAIREQFDKLVADLPDPDKYNT